MLLGWPTARHGSCGVFAGYRAAIYAEELDMDDAMPRAVGRCRGWRVVLAAGFLMLLAGQGLACDGKSYSLDAAVGQIASGGGLQVQLDKIKLLDKVPDKYTISVKDDADILADHVVLIQHDTLSFKTRCGTVTIGADRKSIFQHGVLTVNWSYF
jgi:hypothetical protein